MTRYLRCWSVRNILDLYVDGRLTEACRARAAGHLKACPACREQEQEVSAARAALRRAAPPPQAPAGLAASILKELEAGACEPPWRPADLLRLAPAQAAALAALALLALGNLRPGIPSQARLDPRAMLEELR